MSQTSSSSSAAVRISSLRKFLTTSFIRSRLRKATINITARSTPSTAAAIEPKMRFFWLGSTIVSCGIQVVFSDMPVIRDTKASISSEGHSTPNQSSYKDNGGRAREERGAAELGRMPLSTVSGSLIQFPEIVPV
jgi:hypothetical protein